MKKAIRLVALALCIIIGALSFAACDNNDMPASSNVDSSGNASKGDEPDVPNPAAVMFDNNEDTYWVPETIEGSSIEFSLDSEKTFNSISFKERGEVITDYFVEIKQNGEWVEIFHSDEMGIRIGILDKTFTAKDVRLTVAMEDGSGGISEIAFEEKEKIEGTENFRNIGYYTASRLDKVRNNNFDELKGLTDIILFDFGSWDKNGNFIWSEKYDEEFLKETLAELEEVLDGRKIDIWFCLQNYNKETTENTGKLFATEASRKKLTKFAIDICKKYGFVGADIDYEYPHTDKEYGDKAWANYDLFLNYAAKELHKNGLKLSCAMIPIRVAISEETASLIDYVNVMAYDMHAHDKKLRQSCYYICQQSLDYFVGIGFKPEQLVLGLPYSTRISNGATSESGPGYYWIINRWRGSVESWMNQLTSEKGTYTFNGPDMIRDKTYFAMNNGFSGVFNWCLGADIPHSDSRSLSLSVLNTIERFSK